MKFLSSVTLYYMDFTHEHRVSSSLGNDSNISNLAGKALPPFLAVRERRSDRQVSSGQLKSAQVRSEYRRVSVGGSAEMAVFGTVAVLVCGCVVLVAADYVRRRDAPTASAGPQNASRVACAAACDRQTGCVGFTAGSGHQCRLFDEADDVSGQTEAEYLRISESPCPAGWLLHQESCYLVRKGDMQAQLNWEEAAADCRDCGADTHLATPESQQDLTWLLYNPGRSGKNSYIGLKLEATKFRRPDGTASHLQLPLLAIHEDPGCVYLRQKLRTDSFSTLNCISDGAASHVCQTSLSCVYRSPCPAGWLAMLDHCYLYRSNAVSWQRAAELCANKPQTNPQLATIGDVNTWHILRQHFDPSGTGDWSVHVRAADGTQPADPAGGGDDCVAFGAAGEGPVSCSSSLPFICQTATRRC